MSTAYTAQGGYLFIQHPTHEGVVYIRATRTPGSLGVYLSREELQEVINVLQGALESAKAQEPDCDYIIDREGYYWAKLSNGKWIGFSNLAKALSRAQTITSDSNLGHSFESMLREYGPLRPFKCATDVELETIREL